MTRPWHMSPLWVDDLRLLEELKHRVAGKRILGAWTCVIGKDGREDVIYRVKFSTRYGAREISGPIRSRHDEPGIIGDEMAFDTIADRIMDEVYMSDKSRGHGCGCNE